MDAVIRGLVTVVVPTITRTPTPAPPTLRPTLVPPATPVVTAAQLVVSSPSAATNEASTGR